MQGKAATLPQEKTDARTKSNLDNRFLTLIYSHENLNEAFLPKSKKQKSISNDNTICCMYDDCFFSSEECAFLLYFCLCIKYVSHVYFQGSKQWWICTHKTEPSSFFGCMAVCVCILCDDSSTPTPTHHYIKVNWRKNDKKRNNRGEWHERSKCNKKKLMKQIGDFLAQGK